MNNSCNYEEGILDYDQFIVKNFEINIDTVDYKTCDTNKCKLINKLNEYNEIDIKKSIPGSFSLKVLDLKQSNYIKFSGKKFILSDIFIKKQSPVYYNNELYDNLVLLINLYNENKNSLSIIIPLKDVDNDSEIIRSKDITKILEEINSTFVDDTITSHTSINNLDLKNILPDTGYFTYNVNNFGDVIVYTPSNGIEIRRTLLIPIYDMLECPINNIIYLKDDSKDTELPVFYSDKPVVLEDIDADDIYIDCKPVETQDPEKEYDTFLTKILNGLPKDDIETITRKLITYAIKFIFAAIILALIVYFPSFFKQKKNTNNNNNNNNNNENNKNNKNNQNNQNNPSNSNI